MCHISHSFWDLSKHRMSTWKLKLCLKRHKNVPIHHFGLTLPSKPNHTQEASLPLKFLMNQKLNLSCPWFQNKKQGFLQKGLYNLWKTKGSQPTKLGDAMLLEKISQSPCNQLHTQSFNLFSMSSNDVCNMSNLFDQTPDYQMVKTTELWEYREFDRLRINYTKAGKRI